MGENKRIDGRQRLVNATLDCLAEYGYQGSSVRRITSTAGVALNLVRYHFGSKAGLMSESYRHFRRSAMTAYISEAESAGADPVKRLEAFAATLLLGQGHCKKKNNEDMDQLFAVVGHGPQYGGDTVRDL